MEIIGRQVEVGLAGESTRGTAEAVAQKWHRNVVANVMEKAEKAIDDSTMGVLEDSLGSRVVKKFIEGDLQGIVHADALGFLLHNLYGSVTSNLVSGSVYDHEFTLDQGIKHQALSLFLKDGGVQQKVFNGGMLSSFELNAVVDNFIRFNAGFMARDAADNSDTPTYDAEYDFVGRDVSIKFAATEAGLSGATPISAKDLNISWDPGVISDHVLGAYTPNDIYNTKMMIEGQITLNYADNTFKDLFLADTAQYAEIKIEGAADIGGGNFPTITILLNKVQIMDWERSGGSDELVLQPITFRAFHNRTDAQQSKVTLRNLTTSYAAV